MIQSSELVTDCRGIGASDTDSAPFQIDRGDGRAGGGSRWASGMYSYHIDERSRTARKLALRAFGCLSSKVARNNLDRKCEDSLRDQNEEETRKAVGEHMQAR